MTFESPKVGLGYAAGAPFQFQWLDTTKICFSLCYASNAGHQGTLLNTVDSS